MKYAGASEISKDFYIVHVQLQWSTVAHHKLQMFGNRKWICHMVVKIGKLKFCHATVLRIRALYLQSM